MNFEAMSDKTKKLLVVETILGHVGCLNYVNRLISNHNQTSELCV